jgi:hypothetical protein
MHIKPQRYDNPQKKRQVSDVSIDAGLEKRKNRRTFAA